MRDKPHRFLTPKIVHHGPGALSALDGEIRKQKGTCVGLVTDPGVAEAGLCDQVLAHVTGEVLCYQGAEPEPSYALVQPCTDFLVENGCDVVIALGGGSAIDLAKMAAVMVANPGDVTDYFGVNKVSNPGIPVIAIPTTAGTGSEVSPASVFVDPNDGTKKGCRSDFVLAEVAILDPVLTLTLPQSLTASTGIDALTHAIECYTAPAATLMSDMAAERAIELIGQNLPVAYARGEDLAARDGMLMGSYLAGLALATANVGVVHALAQTCGGLYGLRHGIANSLFLPYVMAFNRIGCREKYANVAALLGERTEGLSLDEASRRAVEVVRRLTEDLGIPQHLREFDVPQEDIEMIAERCLASQHRIVVNNPRVMTAKDAAAILRKAY